MSENPKLTADVAERLETEVTAMEGAGRREIAERISIAREWGDLKENAEYHAAKEEAAMLEAKIARIREQLRTAEIVEEVHGGDTAGMGSKVTFEDAASGKSQTFTLVPAVEAKPGDGRLSIDSPVGLALNGAKEGDTRQLQTPSGKREITVTGVEQS